MHANESYITVCVHINIVFENMEVLDGRKKILLA